MATKILASATHGDVIYDSTNNLELKKKEIQKFTKKMEKYFACVCLEAIEYMKQNRKPIYWMQFSSYYRPIELESFFNGVPEMAIESPFDIVKKILEDKGYLLEKKYSFFRGWKIVLRCKKGTNNI